MATITYPVCRTVNDAGTILTGCTVTVASVLDLDGTPVASHGAQVHVAGSLVSVTYDAAAKGDAWITLSVSKSGETITNENASPAIFASADPSRITYLDAAVSSRSTYAGGAVASVTAPVTVGTNNDKTAYKLASDGLDEIAVEAGVNARQALSPILAASAGVLLGAGTGTIVIKGGNVATTRITASTDANGNRTSVALTLPS